MICYPKCIFVVNVNLQLKLDSGGTIKTSCNCPSNFIFKNEKRITITILLFPFHSASNFFLKKTPHISARVYFLNKSQINLNFSHFSGCLKLSKSIL